MSGTIIVLIMVPLWALGSGVLTNLAIISPRPETASEKFADSAMGCFGTVLWFVQIALMGMSTRLSWLAPLISVPASYVFFVLGRQIALDRTRQLDLLPFFETFVTIPVTSEVRKKRLVGLYKAVLAAMVVYTLLVVALALLRYKGLVP